jgi:hypothetical protein
LSISVALFLCGTPCHMDVSPCCVQQHHVAYPLCAISDSHRGIHSLLHRCCRQRLFDNKAYRVWILTGFSLSQPKFFFCLTLRGNFERLPLCFNFFFKIVASCQIIIFSSAYFTYINLLKTKRNLLYIRKQSVPRCKHYSSRL